jgi:phage gpG-like protein
MSLQLSWEIEGRQELSRVLRDIGKEIKDWTPAFRESAEELTKIFANDVFATRGSAIGENWKPLKPSYLAKKVEQGYPADPLVRTGDMQKNFKSLFKSDMAEIWNSTVYFKYHQSDRPRKSNLPRRVMMKLGEQQKQLVVKIFHTYWYKKVNGKM